MSNALAIAAVTATLRKIIDDEVHGQLGGVNVTVQPPDQVAVGSNQINLFLYQTSIDAAWRNMDMPRQVRPGETGPPPLPLNLNYLLTAYGQGDDASDPTSHQLLGLAMRAFHETPLLTRATIRAALSMQNLSLADLDDQIEHVRITPVTLSLGEMWNLWSAFQAKYRISAAYQASVVLIESRRPSRTPLPVLSRGRDDRGVDAQSELTAPFPTIVSIAPPVERQPSAQLGDTLVIRGHHLDGDSVTVRLTHPRLTAPIDIALPDVVTTTGEIALSVPLPNDAAAQTQFAAGNLTASLRIARNSDQVNPLRTTNELSFALAPRIVTPVAAPQPAGSNLTLTLTCSPEVLLEQRATLLFGGREIAADARTGSTATLTFTIPAAPAGDVFLRLRVDGVDSLLIDYQQTPPRFDPAQKVTIP